jgi:hypothetical protein
MGGATLPPTPPNTGSRNLTPSSAGWTFPLCPRKWSRTSPSPALGCLGAGHSPVVGGPCGATAYNKVSGLAAGVAVTHQRRMAVRVAMVVGRLVVPQGKGVQRGGFEGLQLGIVDGAEVVLARQRDAEDAVRPHQAEVNHVSPGGIRFGQVEGLRSSGSRRAEGRLSKSPGTAEALLLNPRMAKPCFTQSRLPPLCSSDRWVAVANGKYWITLPRVPSPRLRTESITSAGLGPGRSMPSSSTSSLPAPAASSPRLKARWRQA